MRRSLQLTSTDAAALDPKLRSLLEVVWECLEIGGQIGCQGKDMGCFMGKFVYSTAILALLQR